MIELISKACEWAVMALSTIGATTIVGIILFIILREATDND